MLLFELSIDDVWVEPSRALGERPVRVHKVTRSRVFGIDMRQSTNQNQAARLEARAEIWALNLLRGGQGVMNVAEQIQNLNVKSRIVPTSSLPQIDLVTQPNGTAIF
jgi:hypothetical protein